MPTFLAVQHTHAVITFHYLTTTVDNYSSLQSLTGLVNRSNGCTPQLKFEGLFMKHM